MADDRLRQSKIHIDSESVASGIKFISRWSPARLLDPTVPGSLLRQMELPVEGQRQHKTGSRCFVRNAAEARKTSVSAAVGTHST